MLHNSREFGDKALHVECGSPIRLLYGTTTMTFRECLVISLICSVFLFIMACAPVVSTSITHVRRARQQCASSGMFPTLTYPLNPVKGPLLHDSPTRTTLLPSAPIVHHRIAPPLMCFDTPTKRALPETLPLPTYQTNPKKVPGFQGFPLRSRRKTESPSPPRSPQLCLFLYQLLTKNLVSHKKIPCVHGFWISKFLTSDHGFRTSPNFQTSSTLPIASPAQPKLK